MSILKKYVKIKNDLDKGIINDTDIIEYFMYNNKISPIDINIIDKVSYKSILDSDLSKQFKRSYLSIIDNNIFKNIVNEYNIDDIFDMSKASFSKIVMYFASKNDVFSICHYIDTMRYVVDDTYVLNDILEKNIDLINIDIYRLSNIVNIAYKHRNYYLVSILYPLLDFRYNSVDFYASLLFFRNYEYLSKLFI